jgi:hypothetical protein
LLLRLRVVLDLSDTRLRIRLLRLHDCSCRSGRSRLCDSHCLHGSGSSCSSNTAACDDTSDEQDTHDDTNDDNDDEKRNKNTEKYAQSWGSVAIITIRRVQAIDVGGVLSVDVVRRAASASVFITSSASPAVALFISLTNSVTATSANDSNGEIVIESCRSVEESRDY